MVEQATAAAQTMSDQAPPGEPRLIGQRALVSNRFGSLRGARVAVRKQLVGDGGAERARREDTLLRRCLQY
jgi:hypothetical protein